MPIERPQKPIAGSDGGADHRENLACRSFHTAIKVVGIIEDIGGISHAACSGFLLGLLPAGIIHFALVKAHGRASMSAESNRVEGAADELCIDFAVRSEWPRSHSKYRACVFLTARVQCRWAAG